VAATFCDPAGRNRNDQTGKSNIDLFREAGITCRYTLDPKLRDVRTGLRIVSAALAPVAGDARLYYTPCSSNAIFVKAMQSYRNRKVNGIWIDEPQDPQQFEHIPDALRYYFVNRRLKKQVAVVGFAMA